MKILDKFTSWYVSRSALPYWSVLFLDSIFVLISGYVSFALCNGSLFTLQHFASVGFTFLLYLICYFVGFKVFHTYSGVLRYSSFVDLQRIVLAVITGLALTVLLQEVIVAIWRPSATSWPLYLNPSTLALTALLTTVFMWASRIWGKMTYEGYSHRQRSQRVFIYGTKAGGIAIAKNINSAANSPYLVAGFVSDNPEMYDKRLMGVQVYPNNAELIHEMKAAKADALIVSPLKTDQLRASDEMTNVLIENGIKILFFPNVQEWDGKTELKFSQLRQVKVEDLLPRDKIEIDMEAVGNQLRGKRILITGAAGSIGSEMVRQVSLFSPASLILIDQAETPLHDIRLMMAREWPEIESHTIVSDISCPQRMENVFATYRPEYVFHAAAYKHVPMMEDNPCESIRNNVEGTRIVADMAVKYGAYKFVMVSTDKAVNPTNVMGCSKRICEIYVQALDKAIKEGKVGGHTQFVTTRFGNVLGSNGSVIPLFREQIRQGGPVTVTHPDIIRFFMLIPEACKLVLEAGTMGKGGEIFVFDMGKPVRIADLAKRMIRLSGAKDVEIKFTGLRDGEKLYEEVLSDAEQTKPTFHPMIKIATVREYSYEDANREIGEMVADSLRFEAMEMVRRMKQMVPEFKSQHSVYESLDK